MRLIVKTIFVFSAFLFSSSVFADWVYTSQHLGRLTVDDSDIFNGSCNNKMIDAGGVAYRLDNMGSNGSNIVFHCYINREDPCPDPQETWDQATQQCVGDPCFEKAGQTVTTTQTVDITLGSLPFDNYIQNHSQANVAGCHANLTGAGKCYGMGGSSAICEWIFTYSGDPANGGAGVTPSEVPATAVTDATQNTTQSFTPPPTTQDNGDGTTTTTETETIVEKNNEGVVVKNGSVTNTITYDSGTDTTTVSESVTITDIATGITTTTTTETITNIEGEVMEVTITSTDNGPPTTTETFTPSGNTTGQPGGGSGSGGGSGTSTTTTTTTTDGDGNTTESYSTTDGDIETDSQGNHAGGGKGCNAEPYCDGDAILCAILYQEWIARCEGSTEGLEDGLANGLARYQDTQGQPLTDESGVLSSVHTDNKDMSLAMLDLQNATGGRNASCPSPRSLSLSFGDSEFDYTFMCDFATQAGDLVFLLALMSSSGLVLWRLSG